MKEIVLAIVGGLIVLVLGLVLVTAIRNRSLPTRSEVVERLSDAEKARLAEAFHLRETLGDAVWPGWGQADIPIIVYNEAYAFLVGYPGEPPAGWLKMPQQEARGGAWDVVPDDRFLGEPYYRQPLPDPHKTPENFTVLVGDQWVATLQTREYAAIAFYAGFRNDLPDFIQPVFPYRLVWKLLMGQTETYIEGLAHESFHAYQGANAPERLAEAQRAASLESRYPWEDDALEAAWKAELDPLYQAVKAPSEAEAAGLARQFLAQRQTRRELPGMSAQMVAYERNREWLEGLAKYAELTLGLAAARADDYQPVAAIAADREFKAYRTQERFWSLQLNEVKRARTSETRFYYSGMAQAALLDRLAPGWQTRALDEGVWLDEELLSSIQETGQ
jgi:hypothetical protein